MPNLPNALPYGIRQIMLTPYTDAQGTVLSTVSYPLPVAMTLGFSETEQYDELRGDDVLVAVHGRGPQVDWSLEAGGLPVKPWSIVSGARVIEEGVTPNRRVRVRKSGDDIRPYFRIDGRVISDSGGNVVARIYRAKANGRVQGDHRGGAFQTTAIDGVGLPLVNDAARWLYEIIQNETDSPLSSTPEPNPTPIPMNVQIGTVTTTTAVLNWDDVPGATAYPVEKSIDSGVTWSPGTPPSATPPATTVTQTALTTATQYQFRVAATVNGVTGDFSTPVNVLTL
jgi:hypothetical protein